jgi:VIT1/CCC1 family predicted Fe2+/Mn2+ transporter
MDKQGMEKGFLRDEIRDHAIYTALGGTEKDRDLKQLLKKLAETEGKHIRIWKMLLGKPGENEKGSPFLKLEILIRVITRKVLGLAFLVKLLERGEKEGFISYNSALESNEFDEREKRYLKGIINDEGGHERALVNEVVGHKGSLEDTQSVILGLNDGLVEILALVAGLAAVATSGLVVVIVGMIAGISGTLSMSGGVYLSSKSSTLVDEAMAHEKEKSPALRAAYHTGLYYLMGTIIVIAPFLAGLKGAAGILLSVVLVSIALTVASAVIAVISDTSIRRRSLEMLAISLGAATVTILFSTALKAYLGISI